MEQETEGTEREPRPGKPSRRSTIMRGVVTPIFGLLAVTCIVLGIMNATVWKPSPHVDARGRANTRYVVTDPGVLPLVDKRVSVEATPLKAGAGRSQVCMALTTAQDAAGWTAGQDVTRIKGLDDWETLDVSRGKVSGEQVKDGAKAVPFKDSDMWRQVECGDSSARMRVKVDRPDLVVLVDTRPDQKESKTSAAKTGVNLQLLWERSNLPDFAIPFYFGGGLLAVLTVLSATVFAMDPAKRRKKQVEQAEELEPEVSVAQALGSVVAPGLGRRKRGAGRHRRHDRDAPVEASAESTGSSTGTEGFVGGQEPKVIDPQVRNMVADHEVARSGPNRDAAQGRSDNHGTWESDRAEGRDASVGNQQRAGRQTSPVVVPRPGALTYAAARGMANANHTGSDNVSPAGSEATDLPWNADAGPVETAESGGSAAGDLDVDDDSQTTVISKEEMESYLARLANEGDLAQDGDEQ
ncbi:hypothetical protein [Bifidobacterium indicum]|uniref:hypothetical protein n=1 Tax=Bifidobacterium indicum TaxID=1691 RepID=UPI0030DC3BF8